MINPNRAEKLELVAREALDLCVMAYMGNCDERQALRMIRSKLLPFFDAQTQLARPETDD